MSNNIETQNTDAPNTLAQTTTYKVAERQFIVESVFKDNASETVGTILLKLMLESK